MNKWILILPLAACLAVGCGDDVKVEKVDPPTTDAPQQDPRSAAVNSNPNIPDAAKQAMGAK
jgi:hypothetical protein